MSETPRVDPIGIWSAEKLDILRDYLAAYTTIMQKQLQWCRNGYHYIDAFAGSGEPLLCDEDEQRFVDGSPRVALRLEKPFTSYTFIEMENWRIERLRRLEDEFPDRRISVVQGDCNRVIVEQIAPIIRRENRKRGFAFLDPFGINLAWETIEAIAATGAIEILLNFATMGLNRAALPSKPDALTAQNVDKMNRVWGNETWRDLLYERRPGLWGDVVVKKGPTSAEFLAKLFIEHRLSRVFPCITEPIPMLGPQGSPLYCLIFAGHNETGEKIASEILGRLQSWTRQGRRRKTAVENTLPLLWTG